MNNHYFLSTTLFCLVFTGTAVATDKPAYQGKGLTLDIGDNARFTIGARLQADIVQFDDDITALEDAEDFRRARLTNQLDIDDWRLRADYDAGISDGWKSVFVQYRGLKKQRITVGNHSAPFSMEDLSSSLEQPFLESSIATALSPGLLQGASYRLWGDQWNASIGVFGDELSGQDRRRLPGESLNARGSYAPIRSKTATVHFGMSTEFRRIDNGKQVRLRVRPGSRLATRYLVTTRNIDDVDHSDTLGLEFAAAYSGFRLQAEAIRTQLDPAQGELNFDSHSVMVSTLIGGGHYRYSRSGGTFKPRRPDTHQSVLEFAVRHAELDLTDDFVSGGVQKETTLGVSWIINPQLRTTLNYSDIEAAPNRNDNDEDVSLWSLRLQVRL